MTGAGAPHPPGHRRPDHGLERLIFFSDAVFAIAITLLVIEIHVPRLPAGSDDAQFIDAIAGLAPNFVGFLISFLVIGAFWSGHHRAFACAVHWDDRLLPANTFLLFAIAAMPFFTALMSAYSNARVPVVAYCVWLLLTALFSIRLQRLVTLPPVVDADVDQGAIRLIRHRGHAAALGASTAILVGLFAPLPALAQVSLLSIPFWRALLTATMAAPVSQRVGTGSAPE